IVRPKLSMNPAQIKNGIDLTDQMAGWNDLVEIKPIQELDLTILPPTHHASPPLISASNQRNHGSRFASNRVLQHNRLRERTSMVHFADGPTGDSVRLVRHEGGGRRLTIKRDHQRLARGDQRPVALLVLGKELRFCKNLLAAGSNGDAFRDKSPANGRLET